MGETNISAYKFKLERRERRKEKSLFEYLILHNLFILVFFSLFIRFSTPPLPVSVLSTFLIVSTRAPSCTFFLNIIIHMRADKFLFDGICFPFGSLGSDFHMNLSICKHFKFHRMSTFSLSLLLFHFSFFEIGKLKFVCERRKYNGKVKAERRMEIIASSQMMNSLSILIFYCRNDKIKRAQRTINFIPRRYRRRRSPSSCRNLSFSNRLFA